MTEAEWLACEDPREMLHARVHMLHETERKFHLITIACVRTEIASRLNGPDALAAFERAADAEPPRPALLEVCARFPGHCRFDWPAYNLAKSTVSGTEGCRLIRDIFGNPFRPVTFAPDWRTETAVSLARGMYESRDFSPMPILADALQDAGVVNEDILSHCRDTAQVHVRGCWVVDLVLGNE